MKFKFIFAWYDLWIGAFWDRKSRQLYIFPFPMFGVLVSFPPKRIEYFNEKGEKRTLDQLVKEVSAKF